MAMQRIGAAQRRGDRRLERVVDVRRFLRQDRRVGKPGPRQRAAVQVREHELQIAGFAERANDRLDRVPVVALLDRRGARKRARGAGSRAPRRETRGPARREGNHASKRITAGLSSSSTSADSAAAVARQRPSTSAAIRADRCSPSTGSAKLTILGRHLVVGERILRVAARARRLRDKDAPVAQRNAHARPALRRESLRKVVVDGQRHRFEQTRDPRVGERRCPRLPRRRSSMHERRRDRIGEAVLRLVGRLRIPALRSQVDGLAKAFDADGHDVGRVDRVRARKRERGLGGRLRPPAHGIGLEVLLANPPAHAEITPVFARVVALDGERGRAGEAVAREQRSAHADLRAPARPILEHRRVVADAQDLAAGPQILRDSERVAHALVVEPEPAPAERRARQRIPRARAVIVGDGRMQSDAGARRDLVADDDACQELAAVDARVRGQSRHRNTRAAPAARQHRRDPWSARGRRAHRRRRSSWPRQTRRRRVLPGGRRTECAPRDRGPRAGSRRTRWRCAAPGVRDPAAATPIRSSTHRCACATTSAGRSGKRKVARERRNVAASSATSAGAASCATQARSISRCTSGRFASRTVGSR